MENSQRVWILCIIVLSLKFLTVKELSTERHFIIWAAKLNQNGYKGITISKFGSKDMMLWKGSSFVFTEDQTLWIASIPIWYDRPRPPERFLCTPSENCFAQLPTEMKLAHRLYHERPN